MSLRVVQPGEKPVAKEQENTEPLAKFFSWIFQLILNGTMLWIGWKYVIREVFPTLPMFNIFHGIALFLFVRVIHPFTGTNTGPIATIRIVHDNPTNPKDSA